MQELIKITSENGSQSVNARDLHRFLVIEAKGGQTGEMFSHWIKRYIEYCGLIENVDYQSFEFDYQGNPIAQSSKSENQQVGKREYSLSIDSAKMISMVQRNDRGVEAREYFIKCEKIAKNSVKSLTKYDFARMLLESGEENRQLQLEIKENAPLVSFAKALQVSEDNVLIGELAKVLKQNDIEIGQNRLFDWLRDNQYLIKSGQQKNLPTQRSLDLKIFFIKITPVNLANGTVIMGRTTTVTPKGQIYFVNKFLKQ
jgi:anti-repressor protein